MITESHIPNNLKVHRQNPELLQSDVAHSLGFVSTDRISKWENGLSVPSILNLFKLSVLYKVPPRDLYRPGPRPRVQAMHSLAVHQSGARPVSAERTLDKKEPGVKIAHVEK